MNKPKFTPGPPCKCASLEYPAIGKTDGKGGLMVAAIIPTRYHSNWEADRSLYRVAPEMYNELQRVCGKCDGPMASMSSFQYHGDCKTCPIGTLLQKARG